METSLQKADQPKPWRDLAREGLVQVREYRCEARAGDPPEPERFGHTSIAIVASGVFGVHGRRRPQLLTGGFLLLGSAGESFEVSHEHGGGDRCLVFEFREAVVEDLAESLRRGAGRRPFTANVLPPLPRVEAIRYLAEGRLRAGVPAMGLEELGLSLANYVLGEAGAGIARPGTAARNGLRERERVLAAISRIEESAGEELGLAGLAEAVGLSPFHFLRLFKRETGVTPYRFLIRARIRRALALLRDTTEPVTGIAFDVGFSDLSNFINTFRREIGCSPSQFRKSTLRLSP